MRLRRRTVVAVAAAVAFGAQPVNLAAAPEDEKRPRPAIQRNVRLVGKAAVTNPSGLGNEGRIADVFAHGNYAYLNAYGLPTCDNTGVHVMDISNPKKPVEVPEAFIPASPGSYLGEGIQVITMKNAFFKGDLLIHQNESFLCDPPPPDPRMAGGISMWDVTNPRARKPVTLHAGDFTNPEGGLDPGPNQTHSMYAWTSDFDGRTYVVLIDDEEFTDVDILDITDPFHPTMVNDELDLRALFGVDQSAPPNLTGPDVFSHDMVVQRVGKRYVMNMNYWDGGYTLLDVTDPRPGNVTLIAESDYALLDEERLAHGHEFEPEGNAHQSEVAPNRRFLLATDEDFNPYALQGVIDDGPYAGATFRFFPPGTQPFEPTTVIAGPSTFVGDTCAALTPGTGTALVEHRGTCNFQVKLDNVTAAGYSAGVVFNSVNEFCMTFVNMLLEGATIPFEFVPRLAGLQLLGVPGVNADNACTTAAPAAGATSAATTLRAVFDGWGYVRLFETDIPKRSGQPGSIRQVDTYAIPESQDAKYTEGFGDLSVHEVAMDPKKEGLAYVSYYAGGFRVLDYGRKGIKEVGAFVDAGGNNFWGVEVWRHGEGKEKERGRDDKQYVLASDRDFGLYIFQYDPKLGEVASGPLPPSGPPPNARTAPRSTTGASPDASTFLYNCIVAGRGPGSAAAAGSASA